MEEILRHANDHTLDLVTNLLYWSRSQLDGASINLTELVLIEALQNPLDISNDLAAQKGISFRQEIDPDIWVRGDADMLQLVVRNLLQNAIKFTPAGGTIAINTLVDNDFCKITISDNGSGIPAGQLSTLFSGNAVPAYGTANEKGVGLGLMLCGDFMERQGGSISVESAIGEGSRFTIKLPLA